MDLRGHGKSSTENDLDLSIEAMCNDVFAVLKELYEDSPPAIVLVGHSMGGSVAAKKTLHSLTGLVVVDVVEGTAMASLIHMQKILSNRMQHFSSIEKAIEWSVRGGSLRNIDSACVSIPTILNYDDSKKCYKLVLHIRAWGTILWLISLDTASKNAILPVYIKALWLKCLEGFYLMCPVIASHSLSGRALTIGQMQGKFQMVVVRHTGHTIQEDVPDEFATLILNFISRNRICPHGVEIPGLRRPAQPQS
ncbi:hypothetical protein CRYUN_Cryun28dG0001600 [Craigia yunnanensis]